MKRKLLIVRSLLFLAIAVCGYLLIRFQRLQNEQFQRYINDGSEANWEAYISYLEAFRIITTAWMCTIVMSFIISTLLFHRYELHGTIGCLVLFLSFAAYLFFFTPYNAVVLGVLLAVFVLLFCVAMFVWVKYKKIPPNTSYWHYFAN